jgi:arsenate reductase
MSDRIFNVLFLCTGNTARSVLAEGILRKDGAGRFNAFSAGSQPKGVVNPFALQTLADHGYPADGYRSKSWDELALPGAPQMDFIFTVCDSAAGETCPIWPGPADDEPIGASKIPPLSRVRISSRRAAFDDRLAPHEEPHQRLHQPADGQPRPPWRCSRKLRDIGQMDGATTCPV